MVASGFKFGLGVALAVLLIVAVVNTLDWYADCANGMDRYGPPPAGHHCEAMMWMHPARP